MIFYCIFSYGVSVLILVFFLAFVVVIALFLRRFGFVVAFGFVVGLIMCVNKISLSFTFYVSCVSYRYVEPTMGCEIPFCNFGL